ncbi:MAG: coiled-coil domain-containing protein-domain-containing protein [Monoraphidium minutum]|nr:MAG: coiled-coil domain-containing protein-domain-containing protein [Monoraphidium minutum]
MVSTADARPAQAGAAVPGSSVERAAAYMAQLEARHAAAAAARAAAAAAPPEQHEHAAVGSLPGRLSTLVKNRRWAKMQQLEGGGEFFSEAVMRQRAPGLWHEHIGRHEGGPPPGCSPPAAGESWAHSLLRADDAARAQVALEAEQAADDAAMSEDEDDDGAPPAAAAAAAAAVAGGLEGAGGGGVPPAGAGSPAGVGPAAAQRRHEFLLDMRARFLCGADGDYVDYAEIDDDEALDDEEHLARERDRDAEDAYFDDLGMEGVE